MYKSIQSEENNMSNLTSAISGVTSCNGNDSMYLQPPKKKRNQPGHPDPGAEVIALSPRSLLATNRFVCEVCNKGFQRDQNLQLHRRGHNLPWKLKQRSTKEVRKKVYICPEIGCVHHDASRALGDLTGIKKHFYRKHGEKKWKCEKCTKKYAVQSDWKAHSKICGTREYRCDCGTVFSRRDSFITHRAFCDALAQENGRTITRNNNINIPLLQSGTNSSPQLLFQSQFNTTTTPFQIKKEQQQNFIPPWLSFAAPPHDHPVSQSQPLLFHDFSDHQNQDFSNPNPSTTTTLGPTTTLYHPPPPPYISATALLQKASQMGSKCSGSTQFPSPPGVFIRPHQGGHVTGFSSSRDEFIHSLASYGGNKAAAGAEAVPAGVGSTETGAPTYEMMMMAGFDDVAFGEESFRATVGQFSGGSNEGGENMTRDFLGLRPLSQSEILSISGLDNL